MMPTLSSLGALVVVIVTHSATNDDKVDNKIDVMTTLDFQWLWPEQNGQHFGLHLFNDDTTTHVLQDILAVLCQYFAKDILQ